MHCLIRSLAQRLCDDLARAEKAADGKKLSHYVVTRLDTRFGTVSLQCGFFGWHVPAGRTLMLAATVALEQKKDTPKEKTMQDAAQFVQLAQTLCYDLARAEKATDGKKGTQDAIASNISRGVAIPSWPVFWVLVFVCGFWFCVFVLVFGFVLLFVL